MFRILIIEDESLQSERIRRNLEECEKGGLALEIAVADCADAANQALRRQCFQAISIDLGLPKIKGHASGPQIGEEIVEQDYQSLAIKLIYTGENESFAGQRIAERAAELGFRRYMKSIVTDPSVYPPRVSPKDIAELMIRSLSGSTRKASRDDVLFPLELPSFRSNYWDRASQQLPAPLCTAAQDLRTAVVVGAESQSIGAADQFRQYVLRMAWAQLAVILRSAGVHIDPPSHYEDNLEPQLAVLRRWIEDERSVLKNVPLWRSCLGVEGAPREQYLEYFDDSRRWRNSLAHTKRIIQDWIPIFEEADTALLALMNVASFWANCPLWFDVQLDRQGSWSGRPLQSNALVPARKRFAGSPDILLNRNHVVQQIWRVSETLEVKHANTGNRHLPMPAWIDWYPYVRVESERGGAQLIPYLLSHAVRGRAETYVYLDLFSGHEREMRVSKHEFGRP